MKRAVIAIALALAATARADEVPDVVAALARIATASGAAPVSPGYHDATEEYASAFFRGFLHPDGGVQASGEIERQGEAAGQAYRRAHPTSVAAILAGYGYRPIEADGTWTRGWETSHFVPDDAPGRSWFLSPTCDGSTALCGWTGPLPRGDAEPVRVHVVGYAKSNGHARYPGGDDGWLLATTLRRALPAWCVLPPGTGTAPPLSDSACP